MILVTPKFYKDFKCIAGKCPDSCCQGWEVDADSETLESYKALDGTKIKKRIDSVLSKDEFGNTIFTLTKNKRCPFLNSDNLCDIHIDAGQEYTPYTCKTFPRFLNYYGATVEIGVSFSCPVASDMMYNLQNAMTFCQENTDMPLELNEIDAQTYFYLKKCREKVFDIAKDSELTVKEKLVKLLEYGVSIQKELDDYTDGGDDIEFFEVFKNPELINSEWEEKVKNGKYSPVQNTIFNENIILYFIFRYFLSAVYDYDVLSKIKMAVVGVLISTYFGSDSWTMHLWSKETEHSQYNMDRYKKLLKTADCLSAENLKKLAN